MNSARTSAAFDIRHPWESSLAWLVDQGRHASHGLAIMRIGFGAMAVLILAIYLPEFSYFFGKGAAWGESFYRTSSVHEFIWPINVLFSRAEPEWLLIAKTVLLMVLAAAFALGWHTRITGPLFAVFWLGFASLNPVVLNTGHYQTFRVLLLFLLLTDSARHWSLDSRRRARHGNAGDTSSRRFRIAPWIPVLSNNVGVVLIAFQLCTIYVTSALWKLEGRTWVSGVAVYYPLQMEELTIFPWLSHLVWQITPFVYVATWVSVFGQLLFPLMLLTTWTRRFGLVLITGMHVGIGILLALPWFSLTMVLADMIFIRESTWRWVRARTGRIVVRYLPRLHRPPREPEPQPATESALTAER